MVFFQLLQVTQLASLEKEEAEGGCCWGKQHAHTWQPWSTFPVQHQVCELPLPGPAPRAPGSLSPAPAALDLCDGEWGCPLAGASVEFCSQDSCLGSARVECGFTQQPLIKSQLC